MLAQVCPAALPIANVQPGLPMLHGGPQEYTCHFLHFSYLLMLFEMISKNKISFCSQSPTATIFIHQNYKMAP